MADAGSLDVSSLLSALIGGLAALAGVVFTQRSERKKAHADRIWQHRAEAYAELYGWLRDKQLLVASYRRSEDISEDFIEAYGKRLERKHHLAVSIFGSKDVGVLLYGAESDLEKSLIEVQHRRRVSLAGGQEVVSDSATSAYEKKLAELEKAVTKETRGEA